MRFYIIITGQPRDGLEQSFAIHQELLDEGFVENVIYSTGQRLAKKAGKHSRNFSVIESPPPDLQFWLEDNTLDAFNSSLGNLWVQIEQLEAAVNLLEIERDSFILKTRADVIIPKNLIKKIFRTISGEKVDCTKTGLLYKIWNPWFDLTKPFYMADECFAANIMDLKKFINYRTLEYPRFFQGITHVRRNIEPFLSAYPPLRDYIENKGDCLYKLVGEKRKKTAISLLHGDHYTLYLAIYYYILHKYFFIYSPRGSIRFRPWNDSNNEIQPSLSVEENIEQVPLLMNTFILGYNHDFLKRINEGHHEDEGSKIIYKKIKNITPNATEKP